MRQSIAILLLMWNIAAGATTRPGEAPATTAAAIPEFPKIALSGQAIPPAQLFEEITRDTGVAFVVREANLWTDSNRPAAVDVNIDQPFWPAVQQACEMCKIGVDQGEDGSIIFTGGGGAWGRNPSFDTPLVTFVVNSLGKTSEVKLYRPDAVRRRHALGIDAYIDPRLRAGGMPLKVITAKDNRGRDLRIIENESPSRLGWTRGWKSAFSAVFEAPQDADSIAVFRGEATLIVDAKTELWKVADVSAFAPSTHSIDGVAMTMDKITRTDRGFEVSLVSDRGQHDLERFRTWRGQMGDWAARMRLIDADGKSFASTGGGATLGDKHFTMTHDFQWRDKKMREPVKLVWPVPVSTRPLALTFEFKDLPLP
jgi:hypothetical protein